MKQVMLVRGRTYTYSEISFKYGIVKEVSDEVFSAIMTERDHKGLWFFKDVTQCVIKAQESEPKKLKRGKKS